MKRFVAFTALLSFLASVQSAPFFLDDQFEMPAGFRIYRAAEKELTGGSYALRFDGQGRLLVGDGTALRRLQDKDADGVFDGYEVIATGLGWRGPQGILVYGDRLFVVGGDGIQLYEGYNSNEPLKHVGRIGPKLNTGGDHDSHTLLRGHDGYIYFMAGNGSGLTNRAHINVENSPCLIEREASVFRISPDGKDWECIANGGRNPPSLGMNYLGDLFSWDSDMEWHVGLPFYRSTRLNHWVIGGDQGWHDVGALPPYYIDNLPGIVETGRGSPNWGVFYEHNQFPAKYKNAFLVCDYRWKDESNDEYRTTGRLVAFHLQRSGARYKAEMETFIRPKPGAKDSNGRSIPFALVDIDVAPDGSIYLTEHNQGVWRVLYDPKKQIKDSSQWPLRSVTTLRGFLELPQPASEWSRAYELNGMSFLVPELVGTATNKNETLDHRFRAIRLLTPKISELNICSILSRDPVVEIRAQAAWLAGLRGGDDLQLLPKLLKDSDPFVRRRAAEALTRHASLRFLPAIAAALADSDRTVRYTAMTVLAHLPTESWFSRITKNHDPHVVLAALTAAHLRNDPPPANSAAALIKNLSAGNDREIQLDLLRVIQLYAKEVNPEQIKWWENYDPDVIWEQARVIGMFAMPKFYPQLHVLFMQESGNVLKFHFFQQLAKFKSGWTPEQEKQLLDWVFTTQQGWFSEFSNKGVEFPLFLQTALDEFAANHREAVLAARGKIQLESLLGSALLGLIAERNPKELPGLYYDGGSEAQRIKLLQAMRRIPTEETAAFLRAEIKKLTAPALRQAAVASLKALPKSAENEAVLREIVASNKPERPDTEIHSAIMNASLDSGDANRGRKIYERLLCNSCHAGGQTPGQEGRIFGPDLAGVTARLTRPELADAIVYPSKQVADRFKAVALTLKDGRELTGFVTEQTADHLTFADATTVHRLAPSEIEKNEPQQKSLMPDGLLRTLSDQEITHLLKFLSEMGAAK